MTQPKKRVYELARELNMTNKELLEKISSLDLGLNSHMSALDETHEAKIRQLIQGGPEPSLEEKRVKPTVIRRRRKAVDATAEAPSPDEADESAEAAAEEDAAVEVEAPAETPAADKQAAAPESAAPEVEAPPAETPKPKKKSESAVVIAPPPSPPVPETPVPDVDEPEPEQPEAAAEAPPAEASETPLEALSTEADASSPETAEPSQPSAISAEPSTEPTTKEEPPKTKAKKKKKESAAKIIKLPERPPVVAPVVAPVEAEPEVPAPVETIAAPVDPQADRPKKKSKKKTEVEEEGQDKKFLKKKISFRKKEVVEGADLYSDRAKPRKGRKGGKAKALPATQKTQITTAKAIKRRVRIDDTIVLSDLAKRMGIKAGEMIARLMSNDVMVTVNQTIDFDTAALVAAEFNYEVERAAFEEETILQTAQPDDPDTLAHRPPVVTIMGHVDHGKTSLLDVIRKSRVTAGEAGGITQHIGAYLVSTEKGDIAFLDTPGHEAFSAMRSRGAHVTDIVILVVAADDGVMPQTVEAINHAKAAKVPVIVAVNKMDKPDANPDRVQRQLAELGITPEAWGGDAIFVHVSAKQESGIDELMEMILLQAELLELKANPNKLAAGHVVEAKLDSGRGPVATVLVKEGTLRAGDAVVCGVHHGKVRALLDDRGRKVDEAGPSHPVEIIGLSGVPMAGDEMVALKDEKDAKQVSQHRLQKYRAKELAKTSRLSLDKLFERMQEGEVKELNLIIKADVDGSMEAIRESLLKLSNEEVAINVMHAATGTITESDISLAAVSEAIIIGFNVRPNPKVQEMANEENVDIRYHNIIYNVIKEIKDAIVGLMKSTFEERFLGRADVREVFHVPKVGAIAGCYVTDGKIERGRPTRLIRDGIVIYNGKNSSLRRFKDDAKEVQSGYECGIGLENFNDVKVGDVIESYYMEEIRPEVE
ncbi:MAG: translation initiation factor IF-2 [Desulfatitalea sp.]|nr:translation initiation factor IF-2 [Desulfatitalea sp.]